MDNFEDKFCIIDSPSPLCTCLTGRFKQSFAYYSLRELFPKIIHDVIKNLRYNEMSIMAENRSVTSEDINNIENELLKLKTEILTDKKICEIDSKAYYTVYWNKFIKALSIGNNTYFTACWMVSEFYFYRKIRLCFEISNYLKDYDYFKQLKDDKLNSSAQAIENLITKTRNIEYVNTKLLFIKFLKLTLWMDRNDLQSSEDIRTGNEIFNELNDLNKRIVINDTEQLWNLISLPFTGQRIIDIVVNEIGYELFTDFLFAEFLIDRNLATKIRFSVKPTPWGEHDVTPDDFKFTIDYLKKFNSKVVSDFGKKFAIYLDKGIFELRPPHYYWTCPYEFNKMRKVAYDLYKDLSEGFLLILKGDLNYRRICGDFKWCYTEDFVDKCLRRFRPTNICILRTLKSELICGLQPGVAEELFATEPSWLLTGNYGIIQLSLVQCKHCKECYKGYDGAHKRK